MVRRVVAAVVCLGFASACGGGDDAYHPTFSEAEASADECPGGGKVLLVDEVPQMTVCNGVDGKNGTAGTQGPKGDPGIKGETGDTGATGARGATGTSGTDGFDGASSGVSSTMLCQFATGGVTMNAYVWFMSDGSNVGMCTITGFELNLGTGTNSQTMPVVGRGCTMVVIDDDVGGVANVTVDLVDRTYSFST